MSSTGGMAGPRPDERLVPADLNASTPNEKAPRGAVPKAKRRRFGVVRRLVGGVSLLAVLAGLGGAAFAWHTY